MNKFPIVAIFLLLVGLALSLNSYSISCPYAREQFMHSKWNLYRELHLPLMPLHVLRTARRRKIAANSELAP